MGGCIRLRGMMRAMCRSVVALSFLLITSPGAPLRAADAPSANPSADMDLGLFCEGKAAEGAADGNPPAGNYRCMPAGKACDDGKAEACQKLGLAFSNGDGVPKDDVRATGYFARACDGGSILGCGNYGYALHEGLGVAKDLPRSAQLYERACEGGLIRACTNLGTMYDLADGVPHDGNRAIALYNRACDGGAARGCANLGFLYYAGEGVTKDLPRAAALFDKACEQENGRACSNLANMVRNGEGGLEASDEKALALYVRACRLGDKKACDMYESR